MVEPRLQTEGVITPHLRSASQELGSDTATWQQHPPLHPASRSGRRCGVVCNNFNIDNIIHNISVLLLLAPLPSFHLKSVKALGAAFNKVNAHRILWKSMYTDVKIADL